ncbi:MAG: OmpH family outer membrane protein [Desulfohalobiaceae bacterium]|nr:OmpH family outer membrane protein [Desulfohalobiaceae bacterium]
MRRRILCLTGIVLFFGTLAMAGEIKIGVVDIQTILKQSVPGKAAQAKLKAASEEMTAELEEQKEHIIQLRKKMKKQRLLLSQEAQLDNERELQQKVNNYKILQQSFQRKMRIKEKNAIQPILDKAGEIVENYAKQYEYRLIMEKRSGGAVYTNPTIDVTDKIIQELNKVWDKE